MKNFTKENLALAHKRIAPYIHNTPVLSNATINSSIGANLFFKCENFQKVGAFKARGAMNALLKLKHQHPEILHVATHSSGNHAQALSWGAKQLGLKATIVMPSNSPQVKKDAVKGYGADIIECEPTLEARELELKKVVVKGACFVPPYDHIDIIEGQSTAALELVALQPTLDCVICPVGGGGLLAGTALASYFNEGPAVFGAEPEMADDAYQSFTSGKWVPSKNPITIADGLKTSLGKINFDVIKEHVQEIFLVTEEEIKSALKLVLERMKIVIEPSSAVALAAVIKNKERFKGREVGIILSGGNIDLSLLDKY